MVDIQEIETGRSYKITDDSAPDKAVVLDFVNSTLGGVLTNEVLLCVLIKRLETMDREAPCKENMQVIELLFKSVELLLQRARGLTDPDPHSPNSMVVSAKTHASHEHGQHDSNLFAQLQQARQLVADVYTKCDAEGKKLIEERTGMWFVWGIDRSAG